MDSTLNILLQIAAGVITFLSASLYYITKWSEIELEKIRANKPQNKSSMNLRYLKNISQNELDLMVQEKIIDIQDLQNKLKTEKNVNALCKKIGLRRKLVEEWVTLGEFSSLYGMTGDYIRLLNMVGIMSVDDLRRESHYSLWKKLSQGNSDVNSLPSIGMIKYWIRNSEKIVLDQIQQV